jgi:glycosyltransferase involved in cell wall biosynthesis
LVGSPDYENPTTITQAELSNWKKEGDVEVLGYHDDIPKLFSLATIVVLPSYYGEGLPKTLIEAAACGRAVVTTDHPGCRDAIEPGKSGLLVPVKNSYLLADAIKCLLDNPLLCHKMGNANRTLAEHKFSIEQVINAHLKIYEELVTGG